jgi:phosphoribosyl 1,2-cyclic phosphate phosphodiesterase
VDTTPDLRLQSLRNGLRRVDAVLYTHAHADHLYGLDDLRRFNHISGRPMPIYANEETLGEIRTRFGYVFEPPKAKGGGLPDLRLWQIGGRFCIADHEIDPVPVLHGPRMILGFRFGALAYLTDCSAIPESSFAQLHDLEILVLDMLRRKPHSTHFSFDQAVDVARRIGARRTLFTHIAHDLGRHEETCAELPAGMALAYDGLTLEL